MIRELLKRLKQKNRIGYAISRNSIPDQPQLWREWELKKKWNTKRKRKLFGTFDKTKLTEFLGL